MKKDDFHAKLAFIFALGSWIPLFNIGLSITSIILAVLSLKKNYADPAHFDGRGWASAALVISISSIVLSVIGMIVFLSSDYICASAVCSAQ